MTDPDETVLLNVCEVNNSFQYYPHCMAHKGAYNIYESSLRACKRAILSEKVVFLDKITKTQVYCIQLQYRRQDDSSVIERVPTYGTEWFMFNTIEDFVSFIDTYLATIEEFEFTNSTFTYASCKAVMLISKQLSLLIHCRKHCEVLDTNVPQASSSTPLVPTPSKKHTTFKSYGLSFQTPKGEYHITSPRIFTINKDTSIEFFYVAIVFPDDRIIDSIAFRMGPHVGVFKNAAAIKKFGQLLTPSNTISMVGNLSEVQLEILSENLGHPDTAKCAFWMFAAYSKFESLGHK